MSPKNKQESRLPFCKKGSFLTYGARNGIFLSDHVVKDGIYLRKLEGDERMGDDGPTASILIFILLLLIDVFFYGFGAALTSLEGKELKGEDKRTGKLKQIMENPSRYVNTVQLVVTLIHIGIGAFYLRLLGNYINSFIGAAVLLLYVLLSFGVLMPKRIAARYPEKWAYACVNAAYYITLILSPLTGLISVTVSLFLRLFGIKENEDNADVTEEEIISMVNEGHEQGVILASEAEMITNIFEFGDKEAKDIMTHRNHIVAIDGDTPLKEAIHFMLSQSNSRYPVYEENIDHIIGVLHLKDAMRIHNKDTRINIPVRKIRGLLREAKVIPETRNIDSIFKMMQSTKTQMVIVIDEYGQTAGLVAMEDILEEIVGNIWDEYDEDEKYIEVKGEDEYVIEGKTPLKELEERFHISFDEEEFETLNGFLISKMDKIPEEDEQFSVEVAGYEFKLLSVENKMIQSVLVTKLPEEETESDSLTSHSMQEKDEEVEE